MPEGESASVYISLSICMCNSLYFFSAYQKLLPTPALLLLLLLFSRQFANCRIRYSALKPLGLPKEQLAAILQRLALQGEESPPATRVLCPVQKPENFVGAANPLFRTSEANFSINCFLCVKKRKQRKFLLEFLFEKSYNISPSELVCCLCPSECCLCFLRPLQLQFLGEFVDF